MITSAQLAVPFQDFFAASRTQFETLLADILARTTPVTHGDFERELFPQGLDLMRQIYQDFLDRGAALEERLPSKSGTRVRSRTRALESRFGRVSVPRLGYETPGEPIDFPRDRELNLPAEVYSLPVREEVAFLATEISFEQVVERLDHEGGAHVPKRQALELTQRAAQDVDAFYEESRPVNDTSTPTSLLVGSADGKGLTMLPEALREATRKAAEAEAASVLRGDPMAPKKLRKHDKRMALVMAVYEQERFSRTPQDILNEMTRSKGEGKKTNKPKPPAVKQKRISASVEKDQQRGIKEMFDEMDLRDPEKTRETVVLLDGAKAQREAVEKEAKAHARRITLVLDIIHVLHYLWIMGKALNGRRQDLAATWVFLHLKKLLTASSVLSVVEEICQEVATLKLSKSRKKKIDTCIGYLRNNAPYICYAEALEKGYPIATGVIEGACRYLVQDRMGKTGARWGLSGAEAVLKLRSVVKSGDWKKYWIFHEQKERERNCAKKAA